MIVWMGSWKFREGGRAHAANILVPQARPKISSKIPNACSRPFHSDSDRSRYFSVTISKIGPTFCAMPPCTSTRLS